MQREQQKDDGAGMVYFAALCHATCLTPFFRRNFGSEALAWNAVIAFFALGLMVQEKGMGWYFLFWLLFLLRARAECLRNYLKGHLVHSKYTGWPWMGTRFTRHEWLALWIVEPVFCVLFGGLLRWSGLVVMGKLVMAGAVSLTVLNMLDHMAITRRKRQFTDAQIEAAWFASTLGRRR